MGGASLGPGGLGSQLLLGLDLTAFSATATQRLGSLRQAAAATETFSATDAQRLGSLRQSVAASETFAATIAQRLSGLVQSATDTETFSSTIVQRLGGLRQSAAATDTFSGAIVQRVGGLRQITTATETFVALAAQRLAGLTQVASAAETFSGTSAQRLSGLRQSSVGAETFSAASTQRLSGIRQAAQDLSHVSLTAALFTAFSPVVKTTSTFAPVIVVSSGGGQGATHPWYSNTPPPRRPEPSRWTSIRLTPVSAKQTTGILVPSSRVSSAVTLSAAIHRVANLTPCVTAISASKLRPASIARVSVGFIDATILLPDVAHREATVVSLSPALAQTESPTLAVSSCTTGSVTCADASAATIALTVSHETATRLSHVELPAHDNVRCVVRLSRLNSIQERTDERLAWRTREREQTRKRCA